MKPAPTRVKCPFCGRDPVKTKGGRIYPHVNPGGVRCIGYGAPVRAIDVRKGRP